MIYSSTVVALLVLAVTASGSLVFHEGRAAPPSGFVSKGPTPADQTIELRIGLASSDVAGLEQKVMSLSTPGSSEFRQWLSADELKTFMRPSDATLSTFNAWAKDNDLEATAISPNNEWVSLAITVGQANELFGTAFETFEHADMSNPLVRSLSVSLPSELVGHVDVVHPTTTFDAGLLTIPKRASTTIAASCNTTITPSCLQDLYGIPTLPAKQKGNKLFVTGYVSEFAEQADLSAFLKQFRPDILSTTTFDLLTIDNGTNPQVLQDAGGEANLDTQYTTGIATGVPITFVSNGNTDFPTAVLDTATALAASSDPPTVLTTSYGLSENSFSTSMARKICNTYMGLGGRGVSIFYSSGDGGVRGNHDSLAQCTNNTFVPVFPATCPYVTSVGATVNIKPETAAKFSSGGFSNFFARPAYQNAAVPKFLATLPSDFPGIFNKAGRGFPDVSFQGVNFQIFNKGALSGVSGTSAATPSFAALVSLLNDRLIAEKKPVLGFLNPFIYSTAAGAFTDIVSGENLGVCPSNSTAFSATTGWDPLTGLGTPVFERLLHAAASS